MLLNKNPEPSLKKYSDMKNPINKLSRIKYVHSILVLGCDLFISVMATFITIVMTGYFMPYQATDPVWAFLSMSFITSAFAFLLLRTYKRILRYSTSRDYIVVALSAIIKVGLMCVFYFVKTEDPEYYKYVLFLSVLDFVLTFLFMFFERLLVVIIFEYARSSHTRSSRTEGKEDRIVVYGIDEHAILLSERLRSLSSFDVVGFVSYGSKLKDYYVGRLPVLFFYDEESFNRLVKKHDVSSIIFARKEDIKLEEQQLLKYAIDLKLKTLYAPPVDNVENGSAKVKINDIKIEDLLGREEISISIDEIKADLNGKVVMVTGAAGSIGSELCRQLASFGISKLVLYDNAETPMHNFQLELQEKFPELSFIPIIGDVRLNARLDFAFRTYRPNVVFHAAAYKHVPLMEDNPCEAVLVNVIGSRNVADKCVEYGAEKMVMISTDKAVAPTNVMGCTKRLAEIYVQSLGLHLSKISKDNKIKFITTRFGNVLGSNGSVIPRFREQIAKGGPVTVTHKDITRYFMTIPEACRLVFEASTISHGNEILVFDMGKPVKIADLAENMIKLAGYVPGKDIEIKYVGLRPGEKMYEVLLSNEENTIPTINDRIRVAKVRWYEYEEAKKAVDELETLSRAVDIPETVILMKKIVVEYKSNNSKFEIYDK